MKKISSLVGRPPTVEGKTRCVNLDDASMAEARRLGRDNISEGIRRALRYTKGFAISDIMKPK